MIESGALARLTAAMIESGTLARLTAAMIESGALARLTLTGITEDLRERPIPVLICLT
jgi:hypothetical protein